MKQISILIKPASGRCNLNCKYCFYKDEINLRNDTNLGLMSLNTYELILKAFLNIPGLDTLNIAFQGGEPCLAGLDFYKQAVLIPSKINNYVKINYSIQTNGTLIDDNWASFFKEYHFLVGISLDGIKETHDLYRPDLKNKETFNIVLANINILKRHQVDFNILTVITKEIAKRINDIYSFYKKNNFNYVQFIPCLNTYTENSFLLAHDYELFLNKLFNLYYNDIKKGHISYNRYFENLIGILLGHNPESCSMLGRCSLQYVFEANGDVYPCDFYALDDYLLGNINRSSLDDINTRAKEINFIQRSYLINQKCAQCKYFKLCRCGCLRERTANYKNRFCSAYYSFFDKNIDKLIELKNLIK